jgi:Protein of unknown function (DUF1236)
MNTSKLLIAVAAAALIAGTGSAFAQQDPARKPITPIMGHNANLTFDTSPRDHTRISEIFGKDRSARKVGHVRFSLSVGTVVPRSVRLVALPQTVIDIQPTWRGDEYFRVGHRIVVVDPQSKEILGVLAI